jgi:protein-L-isoaspartate(D-aspartate) O-methyltransferase
MGSEEEVMGGLDAARRFYAEEVAAVAHLEPGPLVDAFASVERERFLGPGPWLIASGPTRPGIEAYRRTPDADPRHIYHNVLVGIDPARKLNNGQPSGLALWLAALEVRPGDRVVHVGCGVGYYTAIIAEVTGPSGRVTGVEIDPDLAERARANLADRPWVDVITGDASAVPPAAAIFINAGCTHPRSEWLDALDEGGRLVFPLTASIEGASGPGVMLKIRRAGARWPVAVVSGVQIFDCAGARDPEENQLILEVARLGPRTADSLRALRREPHDRGPTCVLHTRRYCLASE